MQIFWLTALVALYLAYRIFGAKVSAETVIKELKIEEKVLENEIEVLQNEEIKK